VGKNAMIFFGCIWEGEKMNPEGGLPVVRANGKDDDDDDDDGFVISKMI
jgi:hypothetical protein